MDYKSLKTLACSIPILNLLDILTTLTALNYASVKELNPFFQVNSIFVALKMFSALLFTVLSITIWNLASKEKTQKVKAFIYFSTLSLYIFYLAVIINNLAVIIWALRQNSI